MVIVTLNQYSFWKMINTFFVLLLQKL